MIYNINSYYNIYEIKAPNWQLLVLKIRIIELCLEKLFKNEK